MDMISAQEAVATALVADNPYDNWERIVADVEIDEEETGYQIDAVNFAVVRIEADNSLARPEFALSNDTWNAVIAMYRERLDNAGDKIGSFGLEIDRNGKYRFEISYDKPDRLNGNFDTKRQMKIDNYLATYQPSE
jgi:hypothetical protein